MAGGIVPKKEASRVDFCGVNEYSYIVRSDLNCYMKSIHLNDGTNLTVHSLHLSCRGGDHYLAHEDDLFYILKGTNYRKVSDMNTGSDAVVYNQHLNCEGGDHYLSAFGNFYIIFQEKDTYRRVSNMHSDDDAVEGTLHPECKNGLYYLGVKGYYYLLKPSGECGTNYHRCVDLQLRNKSADPYSFHPDVINFLPRRFSITKGSAYGTWECIKTISLNSGSPIVSGKVTRNVGYSHQKMSSIEDNWNVSMSGPFSSGDLAEAFVKCNFLYLPVMEEKVSTQRKKPGATWSDATEVEEPINVSLKPDEAMYIWQSKLGLGEEDVLFCQAMKVDYSNSPTTEVLLLPA